MSAISGWLLSITGVILLSVLAEFVLPEGQINKYIKVIFSFIILLVVIMPLPKLFGKNFDLSKFFGGEAVLQEDYLYQLNIDKLSALNTEIGQKIQDAGLRNVEVSINANVLEEKMEIFGVYVDLCDIEYSEKFGSKDITKAKAKIKEIIRGFSLLENVEVSFNEFK
ncbi:MAG: stage III sporulation protein AF [Clostridia bacterium]|nr:stage III sporulation protein AF [Clostridia bacterium]